MSKNEENFNQVRSMAKRTQKRQKVKEKLEDYVAVRFVDTYDQAQRYESLLKSNDIPAFIQEQINPESLGVMVPEELVDEAHVIIDSEHSYEDFYEMMVDDEDDEDYYNFGIDDNF